MIFWKKFKPKKPVEELDRTPIALSVGFHKPPTLQEQMAMYVRNTLNRAAESQGKETFEEANDFDVGEDFEPPSQHETEFGERGEREFEKFATHQLKKRSRKAAETDATLVAPASAAKPSDTEGK